MDSPTQQPCLKKLPKRTLKQLSFRGRRFDDLRERLPGAFPGVEKEGLGFRV